MYFALKILISALILVAVSEIAKRNQTLGGMILSLPMMSVLAMTWMWRDTGDTAKIADTAQASFWFFLPSLPMFLVLPALLRAGWSFPAAMLSVLVMTAAPYALTALILARFGIQL